METVEREPHLIYNAEASRAIGGREQETGQFAHRARLRPSHAVS